MSSPGGAPHQGSGDEKALGDRAMINEICIIAGTRNSYILNAYCIYHGKQTTPL